MTRPIPSPQAWLWAGTAALALHGLLLAWLARSGPAPVTSAASAGMLTRQIAAPRPAEAPVHAPAAAAVPTPSRRPGPAAAAAATATVAPPSSVAPTIPPPALLWHYELRQGEASGQARLSWQPDAAGYRAALERTLDGRALPGWRSQGGFDAAGLAPERFALQRRGRDSQATNFRREQGLISFSASSAALALPAGAQDRLSWMLQLAALLSANPTLRRPGTELSLPVAGLRGELLVWRFLVLEPEDLELPIGPVTAALRLQREGLGPYETGIDAWLDPARHYLPVQLRHGLGEGRHWQLRLQLEETPPQP